MSACHILLGRPWQFDRDVTHRGRANEYELKHKGTKLALKPMAAVDVVAMRTKMREKTKAWLMTKEKALDGGNFVDDLEANESPKEEKRVVDKNEKVEERLEEVTLTDVERSETPERLPIVKLDVPTCQRKSGSCDPYERNLFSKIVKENKPKNYLDREGRFISYLHARVKIKDIFIRYRPWDDHGLHVPYLCVVMVVMKGKEECSTDSPHQNKPSVTLLNECTWRKATKGLFGANQECVLVVPKLILDRGHLDTQRRFLHDKEVRQQETSVVQSGQHRVPLGVPNFANWITKDKSKEGARKKTYSKGKKNFRVSTP